MNINESSNDCFTNIKDYNYGCFYGKDYDLNKEPFPSSDKEYDIVFFLDLQDENKRVSSSVEGVFYYNKSFEKEKKDLSNLEEKIVIKRGEMKEFAKKYDGLFVPRCCKKK